MHCRSNWGARMSFAQASSRCSSWCWEVTAGLHKVAGMIWLVWLVGWLVGRGSRYVLIIHFYVESGQKMIQFNIQFKIESKIFIQWIIHSIFSQKYRFNELFIQYSVRNIDSKFYSKNWIKTIQIYIVALGPYFGCQGSLLGLYFTYFTEVGSLFLSSQVLGTEVCEDLGTERDLFSALLPQLKKKMQITPKLLTLVKIFDSLNHSFNFYWQNNDS